jgi:hypothetical protein
VSLFVWLLPLDLSGLGGPTSCYATGSIALRVSGALKPHHHDKVGIALHICTLLKINKLHCVLCSKFHIRSAGRIFVGRTGVQLSAVHIHCVCCTDCEALATLCSEGYWLPRSICLICMGLSKLNIPTCNTGSVILLTWGTCLIVLNGVTISSELSLVRCLLSCVFMYALRKRVAFSKKPQTSEQGNNCNLVEDFI